MTSISVIIPSFNSGAYIGEAIASVLTQPVGVSEVLVQDGGSEDETPEVVRGFDDQRVAFYQEPDRGQTDALNRALSRVKGDWIMWMNADDFVIPDALGHFAPFLHGDVDLIYGDYVVVDEQGAPVKRYASAPAFTRERFLIHGCYVFSGTCLFRRDVFKRLGTFDESLDYSMDYEFYLRIAPSLVAQHCGEDVACFRLQRESKTMARPWGQWVENARLIWRYGRTQPRLLPLAIMKHLAGAGYLLTRPVWQSATWRRIRPEKKLGRARSDPSPPPS